MRLVTLAIVLAAVLFGVEAAAVQEQQLPYSGMALTPSGAPVADGLHQMEFRLYTGATASEPVWTELQLVQTRSGSYQVVLGQSRPLPLTTGQQYWLEVLCDGVSLGRMPLALLPSQMETKVAGRSLQELHLNPAQSAAPDGWVRAGLPTLGGATPPQPLVVNTCEECTTTFWALTGNAGTNPNNNFLGTTDDQPLIIRTNNVNRVRITTGGQIEVLNSARSVSLGERAGLSQDLTAFRYNVFVGFHAGAATETGIRNVAVGSGALSQNIDGSSNTALGSNAMSTLTTGDYNTAIGYGAEVGDGLTNATAIGAFAFAGQSNTVVIGSIQGVNGATATANVGIGTTTPMNRLHVVSTADPLRLEGLLVNSALDNVLVVDASGVVKKRSLSGFVGSTAWLLTGNTLTGTEVLGSLNAQPLVVVTDGTERMRVTASGVVRIQNQDPTLTKLEVLAAGSAGTGATQVVLQAGTGQSGTNLLEWQDAGGTVLGRIDGAGNLFVNTNTTLGAGVANQVIVNAGDVELPNIPSGSTATEVLVWNAGDVERRSASGLISGFAWMLGGNTLTSEQTLGTLSAHDLPIITAGTERVRITQAGHVLPGADNAYDLGSAALRWRSGYFGTSVVVGSTVSLQTGPDRLQYSGAGLIRAVGDVVVETGSPAWERMRVTASGVVRIQNQDPAGTPTLTKLEVLAGNAGAGATQVVLQAGTGQSGTNLLEWRDGTGQLIGVIDDAGFMGIGVNNAGFGGIAAYLHVYSNLAQPAAIFENGAVGIGTNAPAFGSTLHIYDARTLPGTGATRVIIQAGANQAGVNLLEWQDNTGLPIGFIDNAGNVAIGDVNDPGFLGAGAYLHVYSNTAQPAAIFQRGVVGIGTGAPAIGGPVLHVVGENSGSAAARFEAGAGNTPLELQGVPTAAATDEVLRIDPATGEVKKSTAAAVVSAGIIKGSFTIPASGGSSFTISVAPATIQPGAIVTVTLVGPSGGTIYPLMVTNVGANTITVESSASIPVGYAIHYIIINP